MANTYNLISSTTLSSSQATVTLSSIPQTFTDLCIKVSARTDANRLSGGYWGYITPNNTGTIVGKNVKAEWGTTALSDLSQMVWFSASDFTANSFGNSEIYIPNYSNTTTFKSMSMDGAAETNDAARANLGLTAQLWSSTAAITSLVFAPLNGNFVSGSSFYLYGIKNS